MADADPMVTEHQVHPATAQILRYFDHAHLPPHLQVVSAPFGELAHYAVETLQLEGAELTTGLRKMLEGKDCVVRSALDLEPQQLMARAAAGVPEKPPARPLVQQMAVDTATRTLTVGVACPAVMPPEQVADAVRAEVLDRLQRSTAEQSAQPAYMRPRPISDSPQA